MKRRYMVIILVLIFGALFWAITRDYSKKFVEPAEKTKEETVIPENLPAQIEDLIVVGLPLPESVVSSSPLTIKGRARGNWFFEATAPVSVVNWDGLIIGEGYIKVDEGNEWMTTDFVPFTGVINYDSILVGTYKYGSLILKKDNPSDNPAFDKSLEFKILFP